MHGKKDQTCQACKEGYRTVLNARTDRATREAKEKISRGRGQALTGVKFRGVK
jgi:hypothetical protein